MKWFIKCLKHYTNFSGRARRKEYWWFMVFNTLFSAILFTCWLVPVSMMIVAESGEPVLDEMAVITAAAKKPFLYIYIIYYIAMIIPCLAVTVRRLHDIGKSGYWCFFVVGGSIIGNIGNLFSKTNTVIYLLFLFIALAMTIVSLVWMFTGSDYGPNQYGPNPKGEGNPEEQE
ncbi:MAG: DUF805 domain-containing protein [Bacteroidales bacterium]|nr:DUF805 domain-containing protein [Bacteroidales bacterium]